MSPTSYRWRATPIVGTAIGLCTPHGADVAALGTALEHGGPAAGALHVPPAVLDAALAPLVPAGEQRRMDRLTRFGVAAGLACVRGAGLVVTDENRDRLGVLFNTAFGAVASTDEFMATATPDLRAASPLLFPYTVQNACTGLVTILLGMRGTNSTVSGMNPILHACDALATGRASAILAGGYDELTGPIAGALTRPTRLLAEGGHPTTRVAEPVRAVAEGAVAVMLETAEHAAARGAPPLFHVLGYGTALSLQGDGPATVDNSRTVEPGAIAQAMRAALADAGVAPGAVEMVVGAARADNAQDAAEDEAVTAVFGVAPETVRPKIALGDMLGASDALGVAAAVAVGARLGGGATAGAPAGGAARDVGPVILVNGLQLGGLVSSLVLRLP